MKKSTKLFALLISLIVLICATVLVISASDAPDFKVADTTYDTWADAVTAAGGTEIIYLNDDIEIPLTGLSVTADARVDLNGKTITMPNTTASSNNNGSVFTLNTNDISLEILGTGTILKAGRFISGTGKNVNIEINAYGDGIIFERNGPLSNGASNVFEISAGSDITVTGNLTVNAMTPMVYLFTLSAGTSLEDTTNLTVSAANIVHNPVWLTNRYYNGGQAYFVNLDQYTKIEINSSNVDMIDGNMFGVNTSTFKTTNLDSTSDTSDFVPCTAFISAHDSTLLARTGGIRLTNNTSMGTLFNFLTAPVEVRFTDCTLMGANRTANLTANKGSVINPQRFYFKNVDYAGDPDTLYGSCGFTYGNMNMDWNGGTVQVINNTAQKIGVIFFEQYKAAYAAYYKQEQFVGTADYGKTLSATKFSASDFDTADELFSEIVKLAAKTDVTITNTQNLVVYNEAGTKVSLTKGVSYTPSDPNGDGDKSDTLLFTVDDSWKNNSNYLCSYETWNNVILFAENAHSAAAFFPNNVTYPYTEIKNGDELVSWYGVRLANIAFDGSSAPNAASVTYVGTKQTNAWLLKDGVWKKYSSAYLESYTAPTTPTNSGEEGPVANRTTVFNPLYDYCIYATSTGTETEGSLTSWQSNYKDFLRAGISYEGVGRFGAVRYIPESESANGYFRFEVTEDMKKYQDSQSYFEIAATGYGSLKTASDTSEGAYGYVLNSAASYPLAEYQYVVQEFDIWTDSGEYTAGSVGYLNRFIRPYFSSTKGYTTETKQNQTGDIFNIYDDGEIYMVDANGKGQRTMLSTDGTSSRITLIMEIVVEETSYDLKVSEKLTLEGRKGYVANNSRLHIFVDGNYLGTSSKLAGSTVIDESVISTWGLDAIRFNFKGDDTSFEAHKGSSICIDNFYLAYYKDTNEMAEVIQNAISTKSIEYGECFNYHGGHIVDGVRYETEEEALAALEPGSTLELDSNVHSLINAPENLRIITNGYSLAGIVSAQRVFEHKGTVYMLPAKGDESVTVKYESTEAGIDESRNAGVGTVISSPVDLSEYGILNVGGKDTYLIGWTLTEGEDAIFVDGSKNIAYPVYGAANVTWTDAGGKTLKTELYRPGTKPTLPDDLVYDSTSTINSWYSLEVTGWTKALDTELVNGDNVLSPDTKAFAPEGTIEDIKIGLTLYTYYELNIYLPIYSRDSRITDVQISEGGAYLGRRLVVGSNNKVTGEDWTINGLAYEKYYINIGVAETAARTYTVSYKVDGVKLTREIVYAVPYYASQVMDDESQPAKAKKLVVNMANYALATINLMGADDDVRIYETIVERYASYLEDYSKLADERFAAEDNAETEVTNDIYLDKIADLTYKTGEHSEYISGASFLFSTYEPAFVIKYSDTAKAFKDKDGNVIGVQIPDSNGSIYYHKVGIYTYFQYGNGSSGPCSHFAFDSEGNQITITDGTSASVDYYAYSYNPHANSNRYNRSFALKNINEDINIIINAVSYVANENANDPESVLETGKFTYSLAAYIQAMIAERDAAEAAYDAAVAASASNVDELLATLETYEKTVTAAKALYAYSEAAKAY